MNVDSLLRQAISQPPGQRPAGYFNAVEIERILEAQRVAVEGSGDRLPPPPPPAPPAGPPEPLPPLPSILPTAGQFVLAVAKRSVPGIIGAIGLYVANKLTNDPAPLENVTALLPSDILALQAGAVSRASGRARLPSQTTQATDGV